MDLDLTDKTALVTGSTRGIGLATAIGLAGGFFWLLGLPPRARTSSGCR